jgi:cellulose synthase/poly-beta-1,6-N-acetylglucosamine synthase-like glycosyltransferase
MSPQTKSRVKTSSWGKAKPDLFLLFLGLTCLKAAVYIFMHNRLNAGLYLFLAAGYFALHGRAGFKSFWSWLSITGAPYLFALYYLDFGLIWTALALDLASAGGFLILKKGVK